MAKLRIVRKRSKTGTRYYVQGKRISAKEAKRRQKISRALILRNTPNVKTKRRKKTSQRIASKKFIGKSVQGNNYRLPNRTWQGLFDVVAAGETDETETSKIENFVFNPPVKSTQSQQMRPAQILNMNKIAYTGAIRRLIICSAHR